MAIVTIHRKAHFNAAHRLHNDQWSDDKNLTVFGKCANPNFHGHNYDLTVSLTGEVDANTGFVMDMKILKDLIKIHIEDHFDHKNINEQVVEFENLNPTVENIAIVIWHRLRPFIDKNLLLSITLYETSRNFVTYEGN